METTMDGHIPVSIRRVQRREPSIASQRLPHLLESYHPDPVAPGCFMQTVVLLGVPCVEGSTVLSASPKVVPRPVPSPTPRAGSMW